MRHPIRSPCIVNFSVDLTSRFRCSNNINNANSCSQGYSQVRCVKSDHVEGTERQMHGLVPISQKRHSSDKFAKTDLGPTKALFGFFAMIEI